MVAVAAALVVAVAAAGALTAASSRAQGAADASALAAASEARDRRAMGWIERPDGGDPCHEAMAVTERWGLVLMDCEVNPDGTVTTTVGTHVVGVTVKALKSSIMRAKKTLRDKVKLYLDGGSV